MTSQLHQDEIEMERRHIREAGVWIARQEEAVVRLDLVGAYDFALQAREPLVRFHTFLTIARARLEYLERNRLGNAPESN